MRLVSLKLAVNLCLDSGGTTLDKMNLHSRGYLMREQRDLSATFLLLVLGVRFF